MSSVKKYAVKTKISSPEVRRGGIHVATALKRADAVLEELKPPCLESLHAEIATLVALHGPGGPRRSEADFDDIYLAALRVIDLSLFLPDSAVDEAARATCALVDLAQVRGVAPWDAIDVHIEAIRLLSTEGQAMPEAARTAIIEGLAKVAARRVGAAPEGADPSAG